MVGDHYLIDYALGMGGFGVTYRVIHTGLEHPMALKEFFPQHLARRNPNGTLIATSRTEGDFDRRRKQFRQEGKLLAGIDHPGVVRINSLFDANDTSYIVMELVQGKTLRQVMEDAGGKLVETLVQAYVGQLVEALGVVHGQGIYHLDIKPENVIIQPSGQPVLVDFGAARQGPTRDSTQPYSEFYAPPELIAQDDVGPEADLFSLGMMLYELLTGERPPTSVSRLLKDDWTPSLVSEPWRKKVSSALELKPAKRPSSLTGWWGQSEAPPRAHTKLLMVGGGLVLGLGMVLVAIVAGVMAFSPEGPGGGVVEDASPPVVDVNQAEVGRGDVEDVEPIQEPEGMVFVPGGLFLRGSSYKTTQRAQKACEVRKPGDDCNRYFDERPQKSITLDAFWIDTHEVTVAQYRECLDAGRCTGPQGRSNLGREAHGEHPINGVNWHQAKAFCGWKGKRLPTEAEWEKAARGKDGRLFPWGDEKATCKRAVMDDGSGNGCGKGTTHEVGSRREGASPYGAMDMAGNVWEWVEDAYTAHFYSVSDTTNPLNASGEGERIVRGGSLMNHDTHLRAAYRRKLAPGKANRFVGFRCVLDEEGGRARQ